MFFTVYILSNRDRTVFYLGISGNLPQTVLDHKAHISKRINCWRHCTQLVYEQIFKDLSDALDRVESLALRIEQLDTNFISRHNPAWQDISSDWYDLDELNFYKLRYAPLVPVEWQ